jgi:hypothetical protein
MGRMGDAEGIEPGNEIGLAGNHGRHHSQAGRGVNQRLATALALV